MITALFKRKEGFIIFFLFLSFNVSAQEEIIQHYIQIAFKNNIVLQQKNISLDRAMYTLKIAKSQYQPTIEFQSG
ncbi:hypothetical protein ABTN79_19665, partial [Acinetobacter baumannii]